MKSFLVLTICLLGFHSLGQDKRAYRIYTSKGKVVSYHKMKKSLLKKDVVLFGELHNNAISHWLELELTKDLYLKNDLMLGAEMIESDNQMVLNQYLSGKIDKKAFDTLVRFWPNYETDYAPLVEYARDKQLIFVASNIPRRYANKVYKSGGFEVLDSLSEEEISWIAPLPIRFDSELPQYKKIIHMMGEHGSPSLVMAQALKDATMAHFILAHFKDEYQFLHFNGCFHSDYQEGILWYLKQARPDIKYATISTVTQPDINRLEQDYSGKADFIICVDEDVTETY